MPHTPPAWLTLPRVTMVALAWVPAACWLSWGFGQWAVRGYGGMWMVTLVGAPLLLLGEWLAASRTVRALGERFDGVGRASPTCVFAQIVVMAAMLPSVAVTSEYPRVACDATMLVALSLMGGTSIGVVVGMWNALVLKIAVKRPRAIALNAPDRALTVLGVLVALPCAAASALLWTESHAATAVSFGLTALVPLIAAGCSALRVRSWRRWLAHVEAGGDARWRLLATGGDASGLHADHRVLFVVEPPQRPFREMERLTAVALVERR
jgi:hypothetical protein